MRRIVLLRSPSGADDPYERALAEQGWQAESVPVLQYTFVNADHLREALASERFGALALTSPRAAEAVRRVGLPDRWKGKTAWVVGAETAARARALGLGPEAEDAGTAERLGERVGAETSPVLFICGNRRRSALPDALKHRGIGFAEVAAYRTDLRAPPLLTGPPPAALGFFSPSGVEAAQADAGFLWNSARIAIGPTTAAALAEAGQAAHAVSREPTPEGFAAALCSITGWP